MGNKSGALPDTPKVLILDDEQESREIGTRILNEEFDVFTAAHVEEAESIIFLQEDLRVLLCDQNLPGENGLDFCLRLKRRKNPMVRVLISAHFNTEVALRAVNDHTLYYCLPKPFRKEELLEVVHKANLEWKRREDERRTRKRLEACERIPLNHRKNFADHVRAAVGIGGLALSTLLIILVIMFFLGVLVLLVLYFIKSALGIDVFADRHLSDFIP